MTIDMGFWVRDFRGFKSAGAGFDVVKPVNVIVGKNNIGKSSLVAAVEHMFRENAIQYEIAESVEFGGELTEAELRSNFRGEHAGGDLPGNHWWDHGARFIDKRIVWREYNNQVEVLQVLDLSDRLMDSEKVRLGTLLSTFKRRKYRHVRLDADRDLIKEGYSSALSLQSNGAGATNIIQNYINSSGLDRGLVQVRLLTALNDIFTPDIVFSEIVVQFHSDNNVWEIYLGEDGKGLVPLSASGSGLKTVILTLLNLLVRPDFDDKKIDNYIFSFEELENNLHPTLQRNLFSFLLAYAQSTGCHIFLTTHSQVAIDLFHGEADAQILHVKKQEGEVLGVILDDLNRGYSVLDDLGAKASDILQANGIIWVEGPSDRVYLNKFIDLWGEGAYKEGHHYQFIYYGGSVLAHIDAGTPDTDIQEAVSAIKINRNFIFACDSDRKSKNGKLKNRVTELLDAVAGGRGYVWVTRCREIENYIPKECFELEYGKFGLPQISEYEYVQDYLRNNHLSQAGSFTDKHHKAVKFSENFSKDNLSFRPELAVEMTAIIERLMMWNS
ncbi:ATP-dependent endonuclease [Pseudomonas sp. Irchel s3h14]|uniref:ATP-dependent nuclease n=1 Tax=Pseudomonas sp. Irchel s3h14 TaxID=2009179 RepID=UPI000BA33059|nr:ATP-binding protein [Pseudomonas sp. Irchel s3h14]